jgi:hypothetical protein
VAPNFGTRIISPHSLDGGLFLSALAVHTWLALFAICLVVVRLLESFGTATATVQWLLKRGRDHPFDAIGYVAAALVFVGTCVARPLLRWMS